MWDCGLCWVGGRVNVILMGVGTLGFSAHLRDITLHTLTLRAIREISTVLALETIVWGGSASLGCYQFAYVCLTSRPHVSIMSTRDFTSCTSGSSGFYASLRTLPIIALPMSLQKFPRHAAWRILYGCSRHSTCIGFPYGQFDLSAVTAMHR